MLRILGAVGVAAAVTATSALGDGAPIASKAPTGYQDYCAAMKPALRNRICGRGGAPRALWRPLHLPSLSPGQACPVSSRRSISPYTTGVGSGPVYPTHLEPWRVPFPPTANSLAHGTGWSVDKTPFLHTKSFGGAFVVRGARIDGPGEIGFSGPGTRRPYEALQFAPGRSAIGVPGLTGWATLVWFEAPGCYALQIDGSTFSRVVVFSVEAL